MVLGLYTNHNILWFPVDTLVVQVYNLGIAAQSSRHRRDDEGFEESSAVESAFFATERVASHSRGARDGEGQDADPGDDTARPEDSGSITFARHHSRLAGISREV